MVNYVAQRLKDLGCYEISLGDTIGIGTPGINYIYKLIFDIEKTKIMLDAVKIDKSMLASHFHNTYDRAIQNLVVSLSVLSYYLIIPILLIQEGVSVIDSSIAGIGGCPYAKGASGNVPTEDVLYMCELLGIEHGVNFEELINVGSFISRELSRANLAQVKNEDLGRIKEEREKLFQNE